MSFSLLHKTVAYLLAGLGLLSLSLGSELSGLSLSLIFAGFVASWFAEESVHRLRHYAPAWTIAVVSFFALQLARALSEGPTLAHAIEFAAFLQISRLFNRRGAADYQQIAVLAFLHLIAATVLSTNLSYAVIFVGFLIATPWMLALSHLRREIEGNYPPQTDADPSARTAIRRVLSSKRVVGPGFLVGTALLSVPLFAMTLAIFVMVPRVGQGFLSFRRDGGQRVAGFGSAVELGGFGVIRDDPTVVVRVMPLPEGSATPQRVMRLRGTSFDHYDGRRWSRTGQDVAQQRRARTVYAIRRLPDEEQDEQLRIVLDHLDEPVVFLPTATVAISIPPRVVGSQDMPRELTYGPGLDLRYSDPDGVGLTYTAFVSRHPAEADWAPLPTEQRSHYLQLPEHYDRIRALALEVVGDAATDAEKAARVEAFLRGGRFTYSLTQPDVGDRVPLEVFLFEAKRGHCEYFSSAMAIMLRTLGLATRNVAGFVGGRYNPYGHYYALRQGDAHSWVEVYLRGRGWVTYDPTPPASASAGPKERLWSDLNALIDALRTRWNNSVVSYDLHTQIGMMQRLARFLRLFRGASGSFDPEQGIGAKGGTVGQAGLVPKLLTLLVIAIVVVLAVRRLRKPAQGIARRGSRQEAQAVALYTELERALVKCGHARPPSKTPLEHAQTLQNQGFPQAAAVTSVTRRYIEARFGALPLAHAELSELRKTIAKVRKVA